MVIVHGYVSLPEGTYAAGAPLRKEKLKASGHWQMVRRTLLQATDTNSAHGFVTVYHGLSKEWDI